MAVKTDYDALGKDIVAQVGGEQNIRSMTHCATRLRFKLRDEGKANKAALEQLEGVVTVMQAGGQYQVVIGNDVPLVYQSIGKFAPGLIADDDKAEDADEDEDGSSDKNLFNKFVDLISGIFTPILWPLAGVALVKAFVNVAVQLGWLSTNGSTYSVLYAAADGLFFFLPIFLAATAAKKFKVNPFLAMAVVAPLCHPQVVALTSHATAHFFNIPMMTMDYTSSVIPAIVTVWILSYVARGLEKIFPSALRNFAVPAFAVVIMVPVVLLTVGPLTMVLANGLASGIAFIFDTVPWLAGAIMGAFWQVFVIFGLHWAIVPLFINDIASTGRSLMMAPLQAAVLAQAAAVLAVALRSKVAARRKLAGPAALSGFLAGITEPAIYGVNLPLKVPFYAGCVGGAIGGAIIAMGHSAFNAFVFPSLLAFSAMTQYGNFVLGLIGTLVAVVIAFVGTFLLLGRAEAKEAAAVPAPLDDAAAEGTASQAASESTEAASGAAAPATANTAGTAGTASQATSESTEAAPAPLAEATGDVLSPLAGTVIPLAEVPDKVFASGAMGNGVGVQPAADAGVLSIVAPAGGKIVAAMKTGHAYGLTTPDGVEILVHVGLDTVRMKGEGFTRKVRAGETVEAGQELGTVDFSAVRAAGYDPTTIMVITNTKALSAVEPVAQGQVDAGEVVVNVTK